MLPQDIFEVVIRSTPLVSIDIILKNTIGEVLLGKRNNRPAKGNWFVPGGRVLKDEPLDVAFKRLIQNELALKEEVSSKFRGVYQHFYDDNFLGNNFATHYVVLAYEVNFNDEPRGLWMGMSIIIFGEKANKGTFSFIDYRTIRKNEI